MITIYEPTSHGNPSADWFGNTENILIVDDVNLILQQPIKIVAVPVFYDIDYSNFDLVLISDIEFNHISNIQKWIDQKAIRNYCVALGGTENYEAKKNFIYRPWWMFNFASRTGGAMSHS